MTNQTRQIVFCHLLLRGARWMPVSVNRELGPNDRCSPSGAVISKTLCAGELREAAFERATVQILDKLEGHPVVGVLLVDPP
jgi:hypothetical protein